MAFDLLGFEKQGSVVTEVAAYFEMQAGGVFGALAAAVLGRDCAAHVMGSVATVAALRVAVD